MARRKAEPRTDDTERVVERYDRDPLATFITKVYGLLDIDKQSVITNTVRSVRGDKVALRGFVTNALTSATVQNKPMTDIELGTILFRLLLDREINPSELNNLVEFLGTHTRTDMVYQMLASVEWHDKMNRLI